MDNKNLPDHRQRRDLVSAVTDLALNSPGLGKVPPQAPDMEQAVLGAILLDKEVIELIFENLRSEYFYLDCNRLITDAILDLHRANKGIDILTVTEQCRHNGTLEEAGGPYYISTLTNRVTAVAHVEYHIQIVKSKYMLREMIKLGTTMVHDSYEDFSDPAEIFERFNSEIASLGHSSTSNDPIHVDQIMSTEVPMELPLNTEFGIPSGYKQYDETTGGSRRGEMIVTAGRPGSGKTSWALSKAIKEATQDYPVLIFSIEMRRVSLIYRLISQMTGIAYKSIERREFKNELEKDRFETAYKTLKNLPIYIDDRTNTLPEIRIKTKKFIRTKGIRKIYVDHGGLIFVPEAKGDKFRAAPIISNSLKAICKDCNISVNVLFQLSRKVEERSGDFRPIMSDLRNAGEIEEDADLIELLYRPEYYFRQGIAKFANVSLANGDVIKSKGYAEIIIAKARNGSVATIPMSFSGESMAFRDWDGGEAPDQHTKRTTVKASSAIEKESDDQKNSSSSKSLEIKFGSSDSFDDPPF